MQVREAQALTTSHCSVTAGGRSSSACGCVLALRRAHGGRPAASPSMVMSNRQWGCIVLSVYHQGRPPLHSGLQQCALPNCAHACMQSACAAGPTPSRASASFAGRLSAGRGRQLDGLAHVSASGVACKACCCFRRHALLFLSAFFRA